jgi:hypothetical protein
VQGVACGGLLHLPEEKIFVGDEKLEKIGRGIRYRGEVIRIHHRGLAGHLDHHLVQRKFVVEGLGGSEYAVVSDHAAFDCRAVLHLNDAGNDTRVREVHLMDALPALCEDSAVFDLDDAKVRPQVFEIDRAYSG